LVTDDADSVEVERLQVNAGYQLTQTAAVSLHGGVLNAVFGLTSRGELGATFGYQWSHDPDQADQDGVTDLTLGSKWRFVGNRGR
jgi:hypothetical protein